MSVVLNEIKAGKNLTGGNIFDDADFDPAPIAGAFLSYGKYFSAAELASGLQVAIETATKATVITDKLFPLHGFDDPADKSTARGTTTSAYGNEYETKDKVFREEYGIYKGKGYHASVREHHKLVPSLFLYDQKNRLLGRYDSAGNLYPVTLKENSFMVDLPTVLTGSNAYSFKVEWAYADNNELLKYFGWVNADAENFSLSSIKGLKAVKLVTKVAVTGPGVVIINGEVGRTKENLRSLYGAALTQSTAWVVTDKNGGTVATGTVTDNPSNDGYSFTINNTAWSAASPGDKFYIKLAAMSVLNASPISLPATVKIESDSLVVTKP